VCFHPTQNYIASSADDRKIKLWKFTSEVAWEDSEIKGHSHNVSCVVFDPKSGHLISNSEDKTVRIWNIQSKAQLDIYKSNSERHWILSLQKNGFLLASGHDEGFDVFSINKEKIPHTLIEADTIIFAQNMELFMYDIVKKNEKKELYQYSPKKANAITRIRKLFASPFQSHYYMVQIE
jgi:coatomer protein complex subunit alpha (xenin)